jgi:hypothetical protein
VFALGRKVVGDSAIGDTDIGGEPADGDSLKPDNRGLVGRNFKDSSLGVDSAAGHPDTIECNRT